MDACETTLRKSNVSTLKVGKYLLRKVLTTSTDLLAVLAKLVFASKP